MVTHSYCNLRYGVLHSVDYVICGTDRHIHSHFETIYYDDVVWC